MITVYWLYNIPAFPVDRKQASPARESRQRLLASSVTQTRRLAGDYSIFEQAGDIVSLNMAAPVWSVKEMTYMRDNPKTVNRSGVYIYNYYNKKQDCLSRVVMAKRHR